MPRPAQSLAVVKRRSTSTSCGSTPTAVHTQISSRPMGGEGVVCTAMVGCMYTGRYLGFQAFLRYILAKKHSLICTGPLY